MNSVNLSNYAIGDYVPIGGGTMTGNLTLNDDIVALLGTGGTVSILYETADANANALIFVAPEGGGTDVPAFIFGDASILNSDLGWFNGLTEPTIAVVNDAKDAYVSLDAGDDAVAGSKGLYFKSAADEDIELLNLSVTGTPRVYWDESEDQIRSTKGWVFDAACDVQGTWVATATWTLPAVTLGGAVTLSGQVFDAGAGKGEIDTTGGVALELKSTTDADEGGTLKINHARANPAVGDYAGKLEFYANSSTGVSRLVTQIFPYMTDVTNGSEDTDLYFYLFAAGASNNAMHLTSVGVLEVDASGSGSAAQVDLFDGYDDALVLRQGIQQNNRELLADMGVLTRKDTGSGYMMRVQPMIRLLAGGIYQTRQMLEDTKEELLTRLSVVENRLALKGG